MKRTPWLGYQRWASGHVPVLMARLTMGAVSTAGAAPFVLDTGASFSFVRPCYVRELLDPTWQSRSQPTGARDAQGKEMRGVPIDVGVRLVHAPAFPEVRERVWVCSQARFDLLGQTFLEKVGAHFQNFPESPRGRRFALYLSPYHYCIRTSF